MNNPFITVTGIDENTPISLLKKLDAEIGILYTATPEGRNRYPSREWITKTASQLDQVAVHICGSVARKELLNGELNTMLHEAQRIQVNGVLTIEETEHICAMFPTHTIVTQHTFKNTPLLNVKASNHALLIDASGGRGVSPEQWIRPETDKQVGFAGGLGSDNLEDQLNLISPIAKGLWWVDMEGKLRRDDWFSGLSAKAVVNIFNEWKNKRNQLPSVDHYIDTFGPHAEHKEHSIQKWTETVTNRQTLSGYREWVHQCLDVDLLTGKTTTEKEWQTIEQAWKQK